MMKTKAKKFNRVYHPYHLWEEINHNMWGSVSNRGAFLQKAIEFTGDHVLYGSYMMRVVNEWPISCENALTDYALNRRAWVGHAAAALAINCPEDITRQAWGKLTNEQQLLANKKADEAIRCWEQHYIKNKRIYQHVGGTLL